MSNPLGGFSLEDARLIHERVLGGKFAQKPADIARLQTTQNNSYYVKLLSNLGVATNPTTGYTQATARIIKYRYNQDTLDMEEAGTSDASIITVTNRYTTFSGEVDDLLFVVRSGAEWSPMVSGVGRTNVVSGNCGCTCIDDGDITTGTYITSSVWAVALSDISVTETNGVVTLPAAEHLLNWRAGSGWWSKNIGSSLTAETFTGTSIPLSPTPSPAYIRYERNTGGYQKLTIQWPDNLTGT